MKRMHPDEVAALREVATTAARSGAEAVVAAAEREIERRRDEACREHAAMAARVIRVRGELKRLPKWRVGARAVKGIQLTTAKRRRGKAADYCAAIGAGQSTTSK